MAASADYAGADLEGRPGRVASASLEYRRRSQLSDHIKAFNVAALVGMDMLMLGLAFLLGYIARNTLPLPDSSVDPPPLGDYLPIMLVHVATITTFFYFSRMYHLQRAVSRFDIAFAVAQNVSIGTLMAVAVETLAFKNSPFELNYPRGVIIYAWIFSVILVNVGREVHRQMMVQLRKSGVWRDRVLIIGTGKVAARIGNRIKNAPQIGMDVLGVIAKDHSYEAREGDKFPLLGYVEDLPELIDTSRVQAVIIALPDATRQELLQIVNLCQRGTVDIKIYPDSFAFITSGLTVDELGGLPLLGVRDIALRGWKLSLKRGLDIVGSTLGLIFLSPFFLIVSLLIYLSDRGPVFFCQERVGMDGKPFYMVKFRTMRVDAERLGRWTKPDDPRKTRIGSFLRKTNLDELPNLINVFYGQMSLVGPRPEQELFVEEFRERIPRYMERHREKMGMTGWAQVNGLRGDTSIEERLKYDLYYVENWSVWFDIKIILRTILQTIFFRNRNAY